MSIGHNMFIRLLLLTLSITAFVSCSLGGNSRSLEELARPKNQQEYRVQGGDTISVDVWGEPRLSGQIYVREDGSMTVPLVNELQARGKTLKEVGELISKKLAEFVPGAIVNVSLISPAPIRYYLSGTFQSPGEKRSDGSITLLQAIAAGGGFGPFADESEIVLIRKAPGGDSRYILNYNRIVDGRQPNPELQNGDVITVK